MYLNRVLILFIALYASLGECNKTAYLEFPSGFATRYTPPLSTDLKFGFGLGFSHFPLEFFSFRVGYGVVATFLPSFSQGSSEVYVSSFEQEIEARSYFGYGFDGSVIAFWPYVFLGPHVNLNESKLVAYASSEWVMSFDVGFRGGAGLQIRFGDVAIKFDSGAGFGSAGLNLRTTIMLGFGIF